MKKITLFLLWLVFSMGALAENRAYKIELIVFAQDMPTSEIFDQTQSQISWPSRVVSSGSYHSVAPEYRQLQGAYVQLSRSQQYQPLVYQAWTQNVASNSLSQAVQISNSNGTLNGFFRLQRGNLLNLIADIEYSPLGFESVIYHLKEKRRFKLNEVHYLDHPKLGVLVRVSAL